MATRARVQVLVATSLFFFLLAAGPLQALKKVRITDNLDDVVDDEEDQEWKSWGKPKPKPRPAFDPPPDFVEGMDLGKYQSEMIKRSMGPSMAFVKLRIDLLHDKEEAPRLAKKWTGLLKTGTVQAKIVAVDRNTIMFTIPEDENILEVKDFVLTQPEAYEFKLGQNAFRRPGDPPLEVVAERLKKEREEASKQPDGSVKEEL